jgi:hypothetical protein
MLGVALIVVIEEFVQRWLPNRTFSGVDLASSLSGVASFGALARCGARAPGATHRGVRRSSGARAVEHVERAAALGRGGALRDDRVAAHVRRLVAREALEFRVDLLRAAREEQTRLLVLA